MSKAKVYDMTGAQLRRELERGATAPAEQPEHSIAADMADGIEAIHQRSQSMPVENRGTARRP